jgi:hypothetical protein
MRKYSLSRMGAILLIFAACLTSGRQAPVSSFPLSALNGLYAVNGKAEITAYRGRSALHLVPLPEYRNSDGAMLAMLTDRDFRDGTIEVEVAGSRRADAAPDERGFIGVAFRIQPEDSKFEYIDLRPLNGRADDQLRRNHSVQYSSHPDFPWNQLRADKASLYVNDASQPCLIVNDLKLGEIHGQIALWTHANTDGYFSSLTVRDAVSRE